MNGRSYDKRDQHYFRIEPPTLIEFYMDVINGRSLIAKENL